MLKVTVSAGGVGGRGWDTWVLERMGYYKRSVTILNVKLCMLGKNKILKISLETMTTYSIIWINFSIVDIWVVSNYKCFNKYFLNKCVHIPVYFFKVYF